MRIELQALASMRVVGDGVQQIRSRRDPQRFGPWAFDAGAAVG